MITPTEFDQLMDHIERLEDEVTELRAERDAAVMEPMRHEPTMERAVTRRGWMKSAAAAAIGGGALALAHSTPTAAANGDPMILGALNLATGSTQLNYTSSTGIGMVVQAGSGGIPGAAFIKSAISGWATQSSHAYGVYGFTSVADGAGVVALYTNDSLAGSAVEARGGAGSGVNATGRTAIYADGADYGVIASGNTAALALSGANFTAPPDRTTDGNGGDIDTQVLSDSGARSIWACVAPGTPGEWRKLAGPFTAGALHPVDPVRVYDSRRPLPNPGKLAPSTSRVVSVADGRNVDTGAIVSGGVPEGASAIAYNVTIARTEGSGFLTVSPGNASAAGASTINWTATGQVIANAGIVKLDLDNQIKVFAGGTGRTDFIIDITGYYL